MNKLGTGLLAACMTMALAATPALAQQGGPGGGMMAGPGQGPGGMMGKAKCPRMGGMRGGPGGMMGKGMMGQAMMHSRPMMEARLAYTKADLEITDTQMDAWNAYADAVRKSHATMEGVRADMMKARESGTAVDRLDARIKMTEARLDSLKALKPATEGLYNVLTDAQKKKADALLGAACHMM
jgi:hypothetical protein